ncbi:MAG: type I DNA topoisomerase [Gemmatimonadota bacterium]|nr:MAG: type I DNA topoisomerase [Gemmatimonadota bacterium]
MAPQKRSTKKKPAQKRKSTTKRKRAAKATKGKPAVRRKPAARQVNALVVVESPTKARTIGRYLGRGYAVKATVGHVRDLPQRELGVEIEKGFQPKYVTIRGKGKTLAELKRTASDASVVYLATDPDREGEAIAWHVAEQIGNGSHVQRVLFHEITQSAIAEAMAHPAEIDERKVEAQQARRILDRLVGYKASPLLWKSVKTGLSAGRVQTVALRLIVEREGEIRAFKPDEYWTIEAELEAQAKRFTAKLHKVKGRKPDVRSESAANKIVSAVTGKDFVVSEVQRKQRRKRPAAPFITSTLQQEAAKRLGFTARRTMSCAQQLYEGVELGDEGAVGLITYMRTDSTRVAASAIEEVRSYIKSEYDDRYLPAKPNLYKTKKAARAQDAHEAVRPTDVSKTPDHVKKYLTSDQKKLYQLIWKRFVASQMTPAVYDTTTLDFTVGQYVFRATGSVIVFDGFHAVYFEAKEVEEEKTFEELAPVPALEEGDKAIVVEIAGKQHFTEPPPRYSEASLVKQLETMGIGRPSTYSSIVSTLRDRAYVRMESRRFHPTELGETVTRVLVARFPNIFNVEFTSEMENELDKVEDGELAWRTVLENFYGPFARALEQADTATMIREAFDVETIEREPCPDCGGKLTVKSGRFGPFIACTNYPECRHTKPLKRDKVADRPTEEICRDCGAPMVVKTGRYGEFLACTKYPKCRHTRPVPLGVDCPKCKSGDLTERRTRRGRSFFGCSDYPDCDFSTWYRPVAESCPSCGNVGAETRSSKARGDYLRCLKCAHEFMPKEAGAAAPK